MLSFGVAKAILSEVDDLYSGPIAEVPLEHLTPLTFYRDYVAENRPVVIKAAIEDWAACTLWSDVRYLCAAMGSSPVHISVTPDGLGDAVKAVEGKPAFVKPWEATVPFDGFMQRITSQQGDGCVLYLSHQNNSFPTEFDSLSRDCPPNGGAIGHLGAEVFGSPAEAVNLWIGDERAVSTCHKDFYENLYCVVKGQKVFHLLPPSSIPLLDERWYPSYVYQPKEGADPLTCAPSDLRIVHEHEDVPWISVDPSVATEGKLPNDPRPLPLTVLKCVLGEGDCLYLPSMWYHRVTQSCLTIAVNYWFNMPFDVRWVFYRSLRLLNGNDRISEDEDPNKHPNP